VVGDRLPRADDLPRLTFTKQVVEETMRLYPPVPWVGRQARRTCTIGGYRVPARGVICLSPYVTQRHPAFWAAPDTFDPDHFEPGAVKTRPKGAYFPFGIGPRRCIGQGLAMMEMLVIAAVVLPRWRFRLQPGAVIETQLTGTLRARNGIPVILEEVGS
jgi:cytochrome P450